MKDQRESISVFTTRPDTIMGVSFIAISTSHNISDELSKDNNEIKSIYR
jgi:leucyl-tRNA synthetase